MKKLAIVFIILSIFLAPAYSEAKVKRPKPPLAIQIVPQKTVGNKCRYAKDYEGVAYGCYWFTNKSQTIYLADDLRNEEFAFVFFHEYGHYVMWDMNMRLWKGDKELAADDFALWWMGGSSTMPKEKDAFFKNAVKDHVVKISLDYHTYRPK